MLLLRACLASRCAKQEIEDSKETEELSTIDLPKSFKAEGKEKVRHADPE